MTEEKWFIRYSERSAILFACNLRTVLSVVMFVGALLTTYDMTSLWADDLHLVTAGRFPEQVLYAEQFTAWTADHSPNASPYR